MGRISRNFDAVIWLLGFPIMLSISDYIYFLIHGKAGVENAESSLLRFIVYIVITVLLWNGHKKNEE